MLRHVQGFREKIRSGQVCIGTAVTLSDPAVSELLAEAGFDFTWIDMEHAPLSLEAVLGHIMALRGTGKAPLVRVRRNHADEIKGVLDLAPAGVIVPMVNSREAAAEAVQACRYPPLGGRGFGPRRAIWACGMDAQAYLEETRRHPPLAIIQIEHIDGVNRVEDIAGVEGLDGICIGPNDLSGSMGKLGKPDDPDVVQAIDHVIDAVRKTDLLLGTADAYAPDSFAAWTARGIQWISLNGDWVNFFLGCKAVLDGARGQLRPQQRTPSAANGT